MPRINLVTFNIWTLLGDGMLMLWHENDTCYICDCCLNRSCLCRRANKITRCLSSAWCASYVGPTWLLVNPSGSHWGEDPSGFDPIFWFLHPAEWSGLLDQALFFYIKSHWTPGSWRHTLEKSRSRQGLSIQRSTSQRPFHPNLESYNANKKDKMGRPKSESFQSSSRVRHFPQGTWVGILGQTKLRFC